METPWGIAHTTHELAPGIVAVTSDSHGGFYLAPECNAQVPTTWRKASWSQGGNLGWYEEDCDWCLVALTFPHLFTAGDLLSAEKTFQAVHAPLGAIRVLQADLLEA